MDKIRSKPAFRKERSLFFIFSVMVVFIVLTALVHTFYNPGILEARLMNSEQEPQFGSVTLKGTKLSFEHQPVDTSYHQRVTVELITRNEPDSLALWQGGTKTTAVKVAENIFTIDLESYSEMVVAFVKL